MDGTIMQYAQTAVLPGKQGVQKHRISKWFFPLTNYPNLFNPNTKIKFEMSLNVKSEKSNGKLSFMMSSAEKLQPLLMSGCSPHI
jgi:hypothetical protein